MKGTGVFAEAYSINEASFVGCIAFIKNQMERVLFFPVNSVAYSSCLPSILSYFLRSVPKRKREIENLGWNFSE